MQPRQKKALLFALKLAITVGILVGIGRKVLDREGADAVREHLTGASYGWLVPAALAQIAAILCATLRWRALLAGQGIHAPYRFLLGSFMIGRFFGAVTPGGIGLQGYRLYDIADRTGKAARSTATIAIEVLCGQMGFAGTVILASFFGLRHMGATNVLLVDAGFAALIAFALLLVTKPVLFRTIARVLVGSVPTRVQTLVDAACAYQGRGKLLGSAIGLSILVHALNNLIYVATARALGVELGVGEVFFVSSLQIFATLLPVSINGVGVREATALAVYTTFFGVPASLAVLVPVVGFGVEMFVSSFGGLFLMRRKPGIAGIVVDDDAREDAVQAEVEKVAITPPALDRGTILGFGGGLLAGLLVGLGEASVVLASGREAFDAGVLAYGAVAYGLLGAVGGAGGGFALALIGRLIRRPALPEPQAYARFAAAFTSVLAFALGAFRIRRDVFDEELAWKSPKGVFVLVACLLAATVLYAVLVRAIRFAAERRAGAFLLRPLGAPALAAAIALPLAAVALLRPAPASTEAPARELAAAPAGAHPVIVIVVDTLRADHLPAYGYDRIETPSLDAFARDAIRFDQAFANASWTRPSFASLLTGRFPSSHQVMSKASALPDALVTLPEAFGEAGYATCGIVTNYNVAPFYNFQQGFDVYRYLAPNFVLGANDAAAKLSLVQAMKRVVERVQGPRPGGAYQDAEAVNAAALAWLDQRPEGHPFFLFAAYMDPHDPYFVHPYDGTPGYARSTHPNPREDEAPHLRELYDGEIEYWDAQLGALLAGLRERGVYDEATIVITSDHGEEFAEHGGFWHGTTLYDEQIRVPLFVKKPFNHQGGQVIGHWVQSIDLFPTLARQNGLPEVEGLQGRSFFDGGNDEIYAEESHEGNVLESLRVRRGASELKVITANAGNPRGLPEVELFRVDQDPLEQVNLVGEEPRILEIANERLLSSADRATRGAVERTEVDVGADPGADRLRSLGYAGGADERAAQ